MLTGPFLGMALPGSAKSPQNLFQTTQICPCNSTHQNCIQQSIPFVVGFLFVPPIGQVPPGKDVAFLVHLVIMRVSRVPSSNQATGDSVVSMMALGLQELKVLHTTLHSPAPSSGPGT